MEPGSDFKQTGHASADMNTPLSRFSDAAEDFEQRRFAGAITPDDTDHLTGLNLKADVLKSPEVLGSGTASGARSGNRISVEPNSPFHCELRIAHFGFM